MRAVFAGHRTAAAGLAALVLLAVAGCSGSTDEPEPTGASTSDPATGDATSAEPGEPSGSSSDSPSQSEGGPAVEGGTAADPAVVEPEQDLLTWKDLGRMSDTVTSTAEGEVVLNKASTVLTTPQGTMRAPEGFSWGEVTVADDALLAVAHDKLEEQPARATLLDLASGEQSTLDGDSPTPTIPGGSWAISPDGASVYYSTFGDGQRYCLATGSVEPGAEITADVAWCVPPRHGYRAVTATDAGVALTTFDDQQPVSCRTVADLVDDAVEPIAGAERCRAWDAMRLGPDAAAWSVVRNENRIEQGPVTASVGDGFYDLGIASTGSFTWCDGALYFARDGQLDRDKARLLRWTPDGRLAVVFETKGLGGAFITQPRCAGDRLSLSAYAEGGDQQVWASLS